jgi:hypothetical protein
MKTRSSASPQSGSSAGSAPPAGEAASAAAPLAGQALAPCPDDVLMPREIVGYLRAREEGGTLTAEVEEHLKSCHVCQNNWAFIEATEPKLRKFREKRVELLIRQVQVGEELAEADAECRKARVTEHRPLVRELERAFLETRRPDEPKWIEDLWAGDDEFTSDRVLELSKTVQEIDGNEMRYLAAKRVAALFECFINRKVKREVGLKILDSLISAQSDSVDLSTLGIPLDTATAFVASFPHTSYFREPRLMEKAGATVLFHRRRFAELRSEFDRIRAAFESALASHQSAG